MKRKDFTPLAMWFALLGAVIVLAAIRSSRAIGVWNEYSVNADTIFVALYIFWMLIEFRISKADVNTEGKKTADYATCQLYGLGQALTFLTALGIPSVWRTPNAAHFLGMATFILGACYRLWAVRTLGPFYSHRVRIADRHRVVETGPYRYTRHPAYAGMIAANAGICVYFFNWITACLFAFVLVPAIILRIRIEEKSLYEVVGYREFAKNRKRLSPGIW